MGRRRRRGDLLLRHAHARTEDAHLGRVRVREGRHGPHLLIHYVGQGVVVAARVARHQPCGRIAVAQGGARLRAMGEGDVQVVELAHGDRGGAPGLHHGLLRVDLAGGHHALHERVDLVRRGVGVGRVQFGAVHLVHRAQRDGGVVVALDELRESAVEVVEGRVVAPLVLVEVVEVVEEQMVPRGGSAVPRS